MTLSDFGVKEDAFSFIMPLEEANPRCILIKECADWSEVGEILEQNRKTHPDDKIWIGRSKTGMFQVGREAVR